MNPGSTVLLDKILAQMEYLAFEVDKILYSTLESNERYLEKIVTYWCIF